MTKPKRVPKHPKSSKKLPNRKVLGEELRPAEGKNLSSNISADLLKPNENIREEYKKSINTAQTYIKKTAGKRYLSSSVAWALSVNDYIPREALEDGENERKTIKESLVGWTKDKTISISKEQLENTTHIVVLIVSTVDSNTDGGVFTDGIGFLFDKNNNVLALVG